MDYVPVRLKTLRADVDLPFNVYIKLDFKDQESRYLKYVHEGDPLDSDRIGRLKAKKLKKMFIQSDQENNYQGFLDSVLSKIKSGSKATVEEKASIIEDVTGAAVEEFHENPQSKASFENAKKTAGNIVESILDDPAVLKSIFSSKSDQDPKVKHSVNCASLGILIGKEVGIGGKDLNDLTMGALFHDVGIVKFSEEEQKLFSKAESEMSVEEKKKYHTHPQVGAELLQDKDFVNKEIMDFILKHEEKISGTGFPSGTTQLTLAEQILGLVAAYDRKVTYLGMTVEEALKDFQLNEIGNYELKHLDVLKKLVKKNIL